MFKNYHIVIFKDRDGGFRNLRLRGWFGILLFLLIVGLTGLNIYLWNHYDRARSLEIELASAQRAVQDHDNRMLRLTGQIQVLQEDLARVQQFDAKLRVLMNIGKDRSQEEETSSLSAIATLNNPNFLAQHRELYARRSHTLLEDLTTQVQLEELDQQSLVYFLRENNDALLSTPSIWPAEGYLTSGFGGRSSPFTGRGQAHKGIDIANRPGTPVWAPARAAVTFAGMDGAYGLCIILDHGNNLTTRYAHLQRIHVKERQFIQRGESIGAIGSTGRTTGPHLHYEVHVGGVPVDPMRYILN